MTVLPASSSPTAPARGATAGQCGCARRRGWTPRRRRRSRLVCHQARSTQRRWRSSPPPRSSERIGCGCGRRLVRPAKAARGGRRRRGWPEVGGRSEEAGSGGGGGRWRRRRESWCGRGKGDHTEKREERGARGGN
uniref:Uncharacterized protein n=1 Tax=Setaria viridis TaxID=4556 RepID=A0A4U6TK09_SETVI|nr:hypothetical protein SEVIR_8G186700v2 [Setaria viridis]